MKTKKKLTPRAVAAVKARLAGAGKTEALEVAGYAPSYAAARQTEFFQRPGIVREIDAALSAAGATRERVAEVLADGMSAEATIVTKTGIIKVPDHRARIAAARECSELRGDYAPKSAASGDAVGSWESLMATIHQQQAVAVQINVNTVGPDEK